MKRWRLIQSGFLDGYTNMAIDESLFVPGQKQNRVPVLRLYGFEPPAVSLGYFQNIATIRVDGYDVVRRLTGGGAILHNKELTYSLTIAEENEFIPRDIFDSYQKINKVLLQGLRLLGIEASTPHQNFSGGDKKRIAFCFDLPSRCDIVIKGGKLAGSAQRRKNGILLQHGSILIEKSSLMQGSIGIDNVLEREVDFEELSECIIKGFEKGLGIELIPDELSTEERSLANELRVKKYTQDSWNKRR